MNVLKIIKTYTDFLDLQNCLIEILKWANMWQMKISFNKCIFIHFNTSASDFQYKFYNCVT